MNTQLPDSLILLSDKFAAHGFSLFLVGGYVRNIVLRLPEGDFDVCSAAMPDDAAKIAQDAGFHVVKKAAELGTIEIHIASGTVRHVFEHTTFRRDYYPPGGAHRPYRVRFTQNIEEDARRRDFTAGALYLNIRTGMITDPTKRAFDDINKGVLRAADDDPDITIRDDGLRIMRMARFAAELKFSVARDLFQSAQRHAELLSDISAERKRDELIKILLSDEKYPRTGSPFIGLELLLKTGSLYFVLPRLSAGRGVVQAEKYHKYDVLEHGLRSCAAAPPVLALRLAALLHDIGKPDMLKKTGKMLDHEKRGETLARDELYELRFDNKTIGAVLPLIRMHMFDLEGKAKPITIRRRAIMLGREAFSMLIALRRADIKGSGLDDQTDRSADNWQAELERMDKEGVPWHIGSLKITGHEVADILGTGPSKEVGRVLDLLHKECVASPGSNNNAALRRLAAVYAQKISGKKSLP